MFTQLPLFFGVTMLFTYYKKHGLCILQIIRVVSRNAHDVDDGWWRGETNGIVGNFPSLIVEECDEVSYFYTLQLI